jgi:glycerol-3-phosphate O-acyltransferase
MYHVIRHLIEHTMGNFSHSGTEHLSPEKGYLIISNHRDIVLDAFLLQYVMFINQLPTTASTMGDNLWSSQFIIDLCRTNGAVRIFRKTDELPARELLLNSQHLSEYLRTLVKGGDSGWIAQRNGRTKDGLDSTDQGVLKMLNLSGTEEFATSFAELNIVPMSISYEYEPCDVMKAIELTRKASGEPYHKQENEDVVSILTGIKQQKGDVNVALCEPIDYEELAPLAELPRAEAYKALMELIDRRIRQSYKLYATNYIAHDILSGEPCYAANYTEAERAQFEQRLAYADQEFRTAGVDAKMAREILLGIYANPITAKEL